MSTISSRRKPVISDLLRFQVVSNPKVSPNGSHVAFMVKSIDIDADKYSEQIYVWGPSSTGEHTIRQWTQGPSPNSAQTWSPCGNWLYFVSSRGDTGPAVYRVSVFGGEAELIIVPKTGILDVWKLSPCGNKIIFTTGSKDALKVRKENATGPNVAPLPRIITSLYYRSEGKGFITQRIPNVAIYDLITEETRPLQFGFDRPVTSLEWSPCSSKVSFVVNLAVDPERNGSDQGLFAYDLEANTIAKVTQQDGPKDSVAWSPCGSQIAWLGHPEKDETTWGLSNEHLWVTDIASGTSVDWMSCLDITVGDTTLVDVSGRGQTGPIWSRCGQKIRVIVSDSGIISCLTMTGPNTVLDTRTNVAAFDVSGPNHTFLEVAWNNAGLIRFPDDSTFDPNASLLAELDLIKPMEIFSTTPAGHDAPAFVLRPFGDEPAPTLVYIHGGPHAMYGAENLFFEYQVLAAAGYCVIYPNPRGSKGYGEAWTKALKGNWAVPAMQDVMAGIDHAIRLKWADPDKLGIIGGSYGGYLTGWIIGQTNRFKAAIPERGVYDLVSMAGTTDFPWRDKDYFDATTTSDTAVYREQSPLTYADSVVTPTMIIHSEGDLRCPISQADQYYRALEWSQKAAIVFVRYGEESSHELSRGGVPTLRIDRQIRIHAWFSKYLTAQKNQTILKA